jgi:hypothetical protein
MLQAPSEDRMARSYVSRLKAAGYFTKGAKVGVLYADQASVRRAYNGAFKAALKAAGVTVAQDAALFPPANPDELGTSETQIQNAVIRFAANQISHVIMFDVHGWSHKDAFMRYAEQQRYRPRYGMNSSAGVDEKDVVSGTDLTPQFHGSVYMSWAPMADLAVLKPTARTQQCYGMLRSAGRPVPTTNVAVITLSRCEYLFFLKDAMDRAPELNFKGFATAAERMGQHLGIKAPSERFGPHRHDGIDQYQMLTYDFACHNAGRVNCWRGTGPRYTF